MRRLSRSGRPAQRLPGSKHITYYVYSNIQLILLRIKSLIGLIATAILLAVIAMYVVPTAVPSVRPVNASSLTISLVATYPYWNNSNPQISVTKGDTITVSLSRTDAYTHQLLIDFDNDGAADTSDCGTTDQCSGLFTTPPPPVGPFTVNANPATYTHYCTVHYTYMKGNFVVLGPNSIPDFNVNSSPSTLTVSQGSAGMTSVTVNSLNGFSGNVNLTTTVSPTGPQLSVNPTSVTLSSGGSASSTLTVSTSSSGYYSTPVPLGNYAVNVTASSGSLHHSTSVALTVGSTSLTPPSAPSLPLLPIAGGVIVVIAVIGAAVVLTRRKH